MGCLSSAQQKKAYQKTENMTIQCHICYKLISERQMIVLNCVHMFHRSCLSQFYTDIRCPDCAQQLDYKSIGAVVPPDIFVLYDKIIFINSLILDQNIFFCPTANCPGIYEIIPQDKRYFQCPLCEKDFCLICHKAYHGKTDCLLQEESTPQGCQNCPNSKCNKPFDKVSGCNIVQCKFCKLSFCFDCRGTKCGHYKCINKKIQKI